MADRCERCDAPGPMIVKGPFTGSYSTVEYCTYCLEDLCDECMEGSKCSEADDEKHVPSREEDDAD